MILIFKYRNLDYVFNFIFAIDIISICYVVFEINCIQKS